MKNFIAAALLALSAGPALADSTHAQEALGDIKALILQHEHVRNPDFLILDESTYSCSAEAEVLTCYGWYGIYYQSPKLYNVEPSLGEFTIKFALNASGSRTVIDEAFGSLSF